MIRVAICDDSVLSLKMIEEVFESISEIDLDWECFSSGESLLKYVENQKDNEDKFDVFLLDIEMPEMNGIELAKKIIEKEPQASIVFLTSHNEYMNAALEVFFSTFIEKPLVKETMISLLKRLDVYFSNAKRNIVVRSNGDIHNIRIEDILYLERKCKYTLIYTVNSADPFKSYTKKLDLPVDVIGKLFITTHSSFSVNKAYIKTIEKERVILNTGGVVPISRQYKTSVKEAYLKYSKEGM